MATTMGRPRTHAPGRLQAFLLAASVPLFLGALLSDYAYSSTFELQWSNFASWLIAGALVFTGIALAVALGDLFRAERRGGRSLVYFALLLATFVLGFINALVHARDAYGVMPTGLALSLLVAVLAAVAAWIAFSKLPSSLRAGELP